MNDIRFGVIGLGLMGREFASAAARWLHLLDTDTKPVITAVCDKDAAAADWFKKHVPTVELVTTDYRELLGNDIDAVYCAVPHHLHAHMYGDIIRAGKHLLGEKPFGIDKAANDTINATIAEHPEVLVRCSSEFPFYPGALEITQNLREEAFGRILEVEAGFFHSSDLDPDKTLNWKRRVATNGEYGCMGDLGLHVLHIPLRYGLTPKKVRAQLSNIMSTRPDGEGGTAPCDPWDNATLLTEVEKDDYTFPMTFHTKRIAPGEANTWFLRVHGTQKSMEFSTKYPKTLRTLTYRAGGTQTWCHTDLGYVGAYPAITGAIFEFGFSDSVLQMWAAFCDELAHGREPTVRLRYSRRGCRESPDFYRSFGDARRVGVSMGEPPVPETPMIVVAGHTCLDVPPEFLSGGLALQPGGLTQMGPVTFAAGGGVANVGLTLGKLGVPVELIAKVGDDLFGKTVADVLRRQPVTASLTLGADAATSYSVVISRPGFDRHFLHHPGLNDHFSPTEIDPDDVTGAVFFSVTRRSCGRFTKTVAQP